MAWMGMEMRIGIGDRGSFVKMLTFPSKECSMHPNIRLKYTVMLFTIALLKGEVQSRITIISKERVKISLQIGAKMMKIG